MDCNYLDLQHITIRVGTKKTCANVLHFRKQPEPVTQPVIDYKRTYPVHLSYFLKLNNVVDTATVEAVERRTVLLDIS